MKVEYPHDLDGRMIACVQRAKLIATALQTVGTSELMAHPEALFALGMVAEELADELEALRHAEADAEGDPDGSEPRTTNRGVVARLHALCAPFNHADPAPGCAR